MAPKSTEDWTNGDGSTKNRRSKRIETKLKDSDEKPVATESVSFFELFKFTSGTDKLLIVVGCFAAFLTGGIFPAMNVLLGSLLDIFIDQETVGVGFPECAVNVTDVTTPMPSTTTTSEHAMEDILKDFFRQCESLCIGILTLGIIQICLTYTMIACLNTVAENQGFCIREKFMRSILRQDIGWFDTNQMGDFATKVTTNLGRVQDGMGQKFGMVVSLNSTTIICLVTALYYGWKLTLVVLAVMPVIILSSSIIAKVQARLSGGELDAYSKAGSVAEEVLSSMRTVVAFGGEQKEINRYEKNLTVARKSGIRRGLFTGLGNGVFWFFCFASYSLAFWYGTKLILESRCIKGEYTASILYIVFICVLLGAWFIGQAAPYAEALAVARSAAKTLYDVIDREPPIDSTSTDGEKPMKLEGKIVFRDVVFKYPSRPDVPVLNHLSIEAMPGETVALVGASGCGKSTVIQLLQRFYDPLQGRIQIDGRDIRALNIGWLRGHIGVVGQEPVLFGTTIAENIRYGSENCSQEDIERAAKEANAHIFIRKLPHKYKTLVGERGAQLSGGQKQRIAIARALIKNPKILLLDEATSALDTESESIVQNALDEASVGRTTIVVAHRLSTIRQANKIIALENGKVRETGTHDELMEQQGLYYQLVMAQLLDQAENEEMVVDKRKSSLFRNSVYSTYSVNSEYMEELNQQQKKEEEEEFKDANPSKLRLLKMSLPEWPYLLTGSIASLVMGLMLPLYGIVFGDILSALSKEGKEAEKEVNFFALIFLIIGIATGLGSFLQGLMFAVSGESLTLRLRKLVFTRMITQDVSWFDDERNSTGALCSKLSSDAAGVQGAIGNRLSTILQALATLVTSIIISLIYNVKIGLVVMAFIPLVLTGFYFESRAHSGQILTEKKAMENASKIAIEAIQNIRTVASLCLEETFSTTYMNILRPSHITARKKVHILGLMLGFSQAVPWMAYAAAMYYGSYLIQTGELYYGELFKVTEGVFAGAWMMGPVMALAPDYDKAKVSAVRIFHLLDLPSRINVFSSEGKKPIKVSGKVEFLDVFFSYPSRPDVAILNGMNLEVNPGQTVALVGSSGCGKSTCIQLLERFYDTADGELLLDGTDVTEFDVTWLRSQIGLVSQEPVLFGYSIAENIAYGDNSRHIPMDMIIDAAKKANIHTFIHGLPGGYDTPVGAKGTQISGGQKQRIAIARALVRNPKILLLDEATSALDTESEKVVQEALDKASEGRTCLTIAHRLSTIQNADLIVVIRKGEVVEKGTHQELLAMNRHYYKLYAKQGGATT